MIGSYKAWDLEVQDTWYVGDKTHLSSLTMPRVGARCLGSGLGLKVKWSWVQVLSPSPKGCVT